MTASVATQGYKVVRDLYQEYCTLKEQDVLGNRARLAQIRHQLVSNYGLTVAELDNLLPYELEYLMSILELEGIPEENYQKAIKDILDSANDRVRRLHQKFKDRVYQTP